MKYQNSSFTLFFKALFMSESPTSSDSLQDIKDIHRLMERSSRFTTLSGWSVIAAGITALIGAVIAFLLLRKYYGPDISNWRYNAIDYQQLKYELLVLAVSVFAVAALSAFYLTWKKTKAQGLSLWSHSSRRVFWNMAIPLGTGGIFVLGILNRNEWAVVAPASLVFYGLALVNAGKYTLADIRYLGYCEILLGLMNLFVAQHGFGYGLYFWTVGFGFLHIIYGLIMWYKYDRKE